MMRIQLVTRMAPVAILLAAALTAAAQEPSLIVPDYSRKKLIKLFADAPVAPPVDRNVQFQFGSVEFRALGTKWRIAYLPVMMPISGSVNYGRGMGSNFPDPFSLTGTEVAYRPGTWENSRAISKEMRRIARTERQRARLRASIKPKPG